jgi:hypothetical protein
MAIASPPGPWERCGFSVEDGVAAVGTVRLRFGGGDGGISGWSLRDAGSAEIDGLPTEISEAPPPEPAAHPNGAVRVDHLVVFTPALGRTIAALEDAGIELRRVREPSEPGPPVHQAFFRLGEVILEVVENPKATGGAAFWGVTLAVSDLDAVAELLGDRLGEIHDAVQPGRQIATVRREAALGLPVALMSEIAEKRAGPG